MRNNFSCRFSADKIRYSSFPPHNSCSRNGKVQQGTGSTKAQPAGLNKVSQHSPGVQTLPASATGLKHSCVYPACEETASKQTQYLVGKKNRISSSQPAFLCKLLLPTALCLLAPVTQPGQGSGKCHQGSFRETHSPNSFTALPPAVPLLAYVTLISPASP